MIRTGRKRWYVNAVFVEGGKVALAAFDLLSDALRFRDSIKNRILYKHRVYSLNITHEPMEVEVVVNKRPTRRPGD